MSTYTPVASQTLSATATSITFSNIPQGYTDLVLVATAVSGDNNEALRFNNDTGSNYSWTRMWGDGTTAYSSRSTSDTYIRNTGGSLANQNTVIINIQNYSNATTYKTTLGRGANPSVLTMATVGLWRNTSPITTITYYVTANSFAAGSTFSLYGIQAGTPKAQGGQIVTTDGTYWYHAFTASGTFTPTSNITADYLVVAGGGSGGGVGINNWGYGGGGGAGGLVYSSSQSLTSGTIYPCVVGAGGFASNGNNSSFNSTSATGGGYGGYYSGSAYLNGATGGSGGGGGTSNASTGGSGTSGQGNAGGNGDGTNNNGGGGGGAAAAGNAGSANGNGGAGSSTYSSFGVATNTGQNVSGTVYFAGGGGGMKGNGGTGAGGNGGGGAGSQSSGSSGTSGTVNTGGGGGGAYAGNPNTPGTGGSGVVIIRYAV